MGKAPHPTGSSCAWAHLWPAVKTMLSTSRSFQTFLKHNVGSPAIITLTFDKTPFGFCDAVEAPIYFHQPALTGRIVILSKKEDNDRKENYLRPDILLVLP